MNKDIVRFIVYLNGVGRGLGELADALRYADPSEPEHTLTLLAHALHKYRERYPDLQELVDQVEEAQVG